MSSDSYPKLEVEVAAANLEWNARQAEWLETESSPEPARGFAPTVKHHVGPLANIRRVEAMERLVADAVSRGATVALWRQTSRGWRLLLRAHRARRRPRRRGHSQRRAVWPRVAHRRFRRHRGSDSRRPTVFPTGRPPRSYLRNPTGERRRLSMRSRRASFK